MKSLAELSQLDDLYRALNEAIYLAEKAQAQVVHLQGWIEAYKTSGLVPEDWQLEISQCSGGGGLSPTRKQKN